MKTKLYPLTKFQKFKSFLLNITEILDYDSVSYQLENNKKHQTTIKALQRRVAHLEQQNNTAL